MCVYYKKPLLESGTLGPKANYQVVIPSMTESYASRADPAEESIPGCYLHSFPSLIDHCSLWARDLFGGLFETGPALANDFLDSREFADWAPLSAVCEQLSAPCASVADCAAWARCKFEELFSWTIRDLLHRYPLDHVTATGAIFWSGSRRPPKPLAFDAANPLHAQFVVAAAHLRARVFAIAPGPPADVLALAAAAPAPPWVYRERPADDGELPLPSAAALADAAARLPRPAVTLKPEPFAPDDDGNFHIEFVAAAANLRAANYRIPAESRLEIKRIAAQIIPAIATTTAMICGFVCLEMYKIHCVVPKPLEQFRTGFVNLAISMFSLSEPVPCKRVRFDLGAKEFSPLWDTEEIKGELTVKEFMDCIMSRWRLHVIALVVAGHQIYAAFWRDAAKKKRLLGTRISEIVGEMNGSPLPETVQLLRIDVSCYNDDMEEVVVPPFMLRLRS
jgi:ubiquitin-activating enzyme E1